MLSISINPPDVVMGSDVTITCLTFGGYPHYQDISLFLSSEVVTVQSGIPYHLHNVTSQDAGLMKCALTDVTSQPSAYSILNVYSKSLQDNKPHIYIAQEINRKNAHPILVYYYIPCYIII